MRQAFIRLALSVAACALAATHSAAKTLLFENFDGENGGAVAQDVQGLSQFEAPNGADLVATQLGGVDGLSLALGVTGLNGLLTSRDSFAFKAGEIITLSALVAGRPDAVDTDFFMIFDFVEGVRITNIQSSGGFPPFPFPDANTIGINTSPGRVAGQSPFTAYSFSFRALDDGALRFSLLAGPVSEEGPVRSALHTPGALVDSVTLTSSAVPEPATWAMMILGFGLCGAHLRARRRFA